MSRYELPIDLVLIIGAPILVACVLAACHKVAEPATEYCGDSPEKMIKDGNMVCNDHACWGNITKFCPVNK